MNKVIAIQQQLLNIEFPKHYFPSLIAIIQSGVLDLKGEKAILHFDNAGTLKMIEYPHRFVPIVE